MKPESLRLLQRAVRINPTVRLNLLAQDKTYGDALVDVYERALYPEGSKDWCFSTWDKRVLTPLSNDIRVLGAFMDSITVRTLIRAEEAANAAS